MRPKYLSALSLFLSLSFAADSLADAPIRVQRDPARDRTWVLQADALYLYEHAVAAKARRFALPGWMHVSARSAGEPDVVVEAGGSVIVSSNIVPTLWRIDPEASSSVRIDIEPPDETRRELGFTTMRFARDGVLDARGSIDGSRWRIDLVTGRAIKVDSGSTHAAAHTRE